MLLTDSFQKDRASYSIAYTCDLQFLKFVTYRLLFPMGREVSERNALPQSHHILSVPHAIVLVFSFLAGGCQGVSSVGQEEGAHLSTTYVAKKVMEEPSLCLQEALLVSLISWSLIVVLVLDLSFQ